METELKLSIGAQDSRRFKHHPLLQKYAISKPHKQIQTDVYFDTPELTLRHNGVGLRVRHVGQGWVQNMKAGGDVESGLFRRHEWEMPIDGPAPDLAALGKAMHSKNSWNKLIKSPRVKAGLQPIFSTRITRTVWELRSPQGDEIECVLDLGNIECGGKTEALSEIELELKSGVVAHLFGLALALEKDFPLQIGNRSKADRGYDLLAPQIAEAVKATSAQLSKRMTVEQTFQEIVHHCLYQIQANKDAVANRKEDVESLHQMRVGLRRLDSALKLFAHLFQLPEALRQDLDWLGEQLGEARDWDVLSTSTLPRVADVIQDKSRFSKIESAAAMKAVEKHAAASDAVSTPRYNRLMLHFSYWLESHGWRNAMRPKERRQLITPIPGLAHDLLSQAQRRLFKRGKKLHGATPKARHKVRIAAKKTRYATEFFESLLTKKTAKHYIKALSGLQNELGRLNDMSVAEHLLKDLTHQHIDLQESAGLIRGYLAARIESEAGEIENLWKKFSRSNLLDGYLS